MVGAIESEKGEMVQLLIWSTAEADGVFMHLKSIGVKVDLDDCCLAKGIDAIESLVKQYKEWCQPLVIATIAYAVLKELCKPPCLLLLLCCVCLFLFFE